MYAKPVDIARGLEERRLMQPNPYGSNLGDRDPITALEETPQQIRRVVDGWTADRFDRSYAPGKWTATQLLIHLAQTELALGTRVRFALSQDRYAAQSFSQDEWLAVEDGTDPRTALDSYLALRRMDVAMFRRLSAAQRDRSFTHPEYGTLTVWWVASQLAGHDLHHLGQLQRIDQTRL
jgi:hypothetical protein